MCLQESRSLFKPLQDVQHQGGKKETKNLIEEIRTGPMHQKIQSLNIINFFLHQLIGRMVAIVWMEMSLWIVM